MRTYFGLLFCLLLILPACDSEEITTSFASVSIGGVYTGTTTIDGTVRDYTITFPTTSGGAFTWDGTVDSEDFPETLSVGGTGTYDHPDITLTETTGDEPTAISGTVSADGATITLDGDENGRSVELALKRSN